MQESVNESQRCLKSLAPKFNHELCPTACLIEIRCLPNPMMATVAWTLNLKIPDKQQKSAVKVHAKGTNSQSLTCGHLAGLAKLFHRSVLTGQLRCFLLERGIKVTLVLIFLAFRCKRTRYSVWINGCKLGFQTFGNQWGSFPCLPWNNSSNQGHNPWLTLTVLQPFPPRCSFITRSKTESTDLEFSLCLAEGEKKDRKMVMHRGPG